MPYPLAELPYGLRCRLSELSTPLERYNLQIAAGNLSICPPKLQIAEKGLDHLCFRCENGTTSVYTDHKYTIPFKVSVDSLIILTNYNGLNNFDAQSLKSDIFGHFILDVYALGLKNCTITKSFWETLKMMFSKVTGFFVSNNDNTSHISFTDMLTAFPNIDFMEIRCKLFKNWMEQILQCGKQTMTWLTLDFNRLEFCDEFDCATFLRFLKQQRHGFAFFIFNGGYPGKFGELHLPRLIQYLDQNLERYVSHQGVPQNYISNFISVTIEGGDLQQWKLPYLKEDDL